MIRFGPLVRPYPLPTARILPARPASVVPVAEAAPSPTDAFIVLVPGEPIPQPRHRAAGRMFRDPVSGQMRARGHVYLPKSIDGKPVRVHGFKADVAAAVLAALPAGWDKTGPVALGCLFVFGRIKKLRKRGPREPKSTKPDADNLLKSVKDACKGIAWVDDAQVSAVMAAKLFGAPHDEPHTVIVFDRRADGIVSGAWAARLAGLVSKI